MITVKIIHVVSVMLLFFRGRLFRRMKEISLE